MFYNLVVKHKAERYCKGYNFEAMLFCQLAHTKKLLEICSALASIYCFTQIWKEHT